MSSLLAAHLANADLLYQTDALDAAQRRLVNLAESVSDENARVAALGRLVEIACDLGDFGHAQERLSHLRASAGRAAAGLTDRAYGELLAATARFALTRGDGQDLTSAARRLLALAGRVRDDARLWSLAARVFCYEAFQHYSALDIAAASSSCDRAALSLGNAGSPPAFAQTHVLTTRAVVDAHDPTRAHLAPSENAAAYGIATQNGMVSTASAALFNMLTFALFCEEQGPASSASRLAYDVLADRSVLAPVGSDAMVAAVAASLGGRHDDAVASIQRAQMERHFGTLDWSPTIATLEARVLFRAARYVDAERAAAKAHRAWRESGLGGESSALRIHAEALEALGRCPDATAAIEDAVEALEHPMPIYGQLETYRCAYRLTGKPAYRERAEFFSRVIGRASFVSRASAGPAIPAFHRTPARLTDREREVALLAADGFTNPAIGRRLGISRKTVANHLSEIFGRLEIRARWQLTHDLIDGT